MFRIILWDKTKPENVEILNLCCEVILYKQIDLQDNTDYLTMLEHNTYFANVRYNITEYLTGCHRKFGDAEMQQKVLKCDVTRVLIL